MRRGTDLLCDKTWHAPPELLLPGCEHPFKKRDLEGLGISIPSQVAERMEHVSQIGLKNKYLGEDPVDHNRWSHVKGVYTTGMIWLHRLYDGNSIPAHLMRPPLLNYDCVRSVVGYSLLLHDYGHLPFSHLLEEALHTIHWVPADSGQNSLEYTVLRDRLKEEPGISDLIRSTIAASLGASAPEELRSDPLGLILQLTHGWCGMPWLQAIVNGPIDADKIDYLRRDQTVLHEAGFPVHTRLPLFAESPKESMAWFDEFLSEQYVNHAGLLCLQGRSALAAIDLWRERLVLYDRFYLSPMVRAADRITLEIVQQFLIRSVMSARFASKITSDSRLHMKVNEERIDVRDLGEIITGDGGSSLRPINIVDVKYRAVTRLLNRLSTIFGSTGLRDWECFAFMKDLVLSEERTNTRYRDMLRIAVDSLAGLKNVEDLRSFAESSIICAPVQFGREHAETVKEIARTFQQQYFADVLIDVQAIPSALSTPPPPRQTPRAHKPEISQLLVPRGPVERWSSGSRSLEPLTAEKVRSLELPVARALILCPSGRNRAKGQYVYDRFKAELKQRQIVLEEVEVE